jgi:hypothetical protein
MTIKDPLSLRTSLYIAAGGAAPRMQSHAESGQERLTPSSRSFLAWIDNYFRQTSAERMAVASLAFWG